MRNLRQSLEDMTLSAKAHFRKEGRYPGSSTVNPESLNPFDESKFRSDLNAAALLGKNSYYSMAIEKDHQSDPKLFDPLEHSPNNKWWPHEEMLMSLKGRAKAVASWAMANDLAVSISDVSKYDPVRRERIREYWLVISWPSAPASEQAA